MTRTSSRFVAIVALCGAFSASGAAAAQDRPSIAAESNIRVEVTITETQGDETKTRTVRVTVAEGSTGQIRSIYQKGPDDSADLPGRNFPLFVDVTPHRRADGKILLELSLELTIPDRSNDSLRDRVQVAESMDVFVESGVPMLISESADPLSDLKVTVEATATVLE